MGKTCAIFSECPYQTRPENHRSPGLAGAAAFDSVDPPDDIHAPGDYRRALLQVLTERALTSAAQPGRWNNA